MDLGLAAHVAVVIGGANGIGRAICEAFAAEAADVALVDIDPSGAELAASLVRQRGVRSLSLQQDAADYEAMRQAADCVMGRLGRCDHVIFAVGAGSGKFGFPFWNLEPSDWERVLRVNLVGAVNVAHAFRDALIRQRAGSMVFLSSVAGQVGSPTDPPYSAAKAGLINFAQCAAKDLAPYNVRVNTVSPGMVKTALNESIWRAWRDQQPASQRLDYQQWASEKVRRLAPLGRCQDPEDVAAAVLFLASSQAKNVTGQTLNVDGGQVMHA